MAENVIQWFEDKLKIKDALMEKLEAKNKVMKEHRYQMDIAVKHKENQGDNLHSIDFHQLQIKNQQYNQKIKDLNKELLAAKSTTVRTVQVLNSKKKELSDLLTKGAQLNADIKDRKTGLIRLQDELERVENECNKEELRNKKYKIQQSNPDMPHVLDYVNQKSQMYDLDSAVKNWERKVEIIEMAGRRAKQIIKQKSELRQAQARAVIGSMAGRAQMFPNIGGR
jgi:molecular chaperone GrpE (heat shock protein)